LLSPLFTYDLDKITDFLSKFKGSLEKDLAQDFANIDIRTDDRAGQEESISLKYMQQLVRVVSRSESQTTRLTPSLATRREPRTTDARH